MEVTLREPWLLLVVGVVADAVVDVVIVGGGGGAGVSDGHFSTVLLSWLFLSRCLGRERGSGVCIPVLAADQSCYCTRQVRGTRIESSTYGTPCIGAGPFLP